MILVDRGASPKGGSVCTALRRLSHALSTEGVENQ